MEGRPTYWPISILLFILAGCSSSSPDPKNTTPAADAASEIRRVASSQLPPLGDYFPPLDEGRLMLASPAGWSWASRRDGYLARIFLDKTRRVRLPRIWVTVEDPGNGATDQLTEDNLVAHARFVHSRLKSDGIKLVEQVQPLVIGTVPCIRYVRATRFRVRDEKAQTLTAERQILETIQAGRRYTIDLQVHPGTVLRHRNEAYSMLAGMEFITPADEEPTAEPSQEEGEAADPED